jgi:hypothetical protein
LGIDSSEGLTRGGGHRARRGAGGALGLPPRSGGQPDVLVLEGEPGIGKGTLWRRGLGVPGERGYRVSACGARQRGQTLPRTSGPFTVATTKPGDLQALLRADDGTRTHDLLHGKCQRPVAPVRARSLKPPVCRSFRAGERTEPNPSERRTLPSLPREPECRIRTRRASLHPLAPFTDGPGAQTRGSHTPRHVFASERLRTGANPHQVQESLGHKHLDPTRRFSHVTAHGLRSAVKRLRRSEPRAASKRR